MFVFVSPILRAIRIRFRNVNSLFVCVYRVYVLLEYSDENAQKILLNRLKKDKMLMSKIKSNEAFKELDESIKNNKEAEIKKLDKIIKSEKIS